MLANALNLLVWWTARRQTEHPEAPVFYFHPYKDEIYNIIVQRIPKQEERAA